MLREPHKIKRLARFIAGLNLESGVYAMCPVPHLFKAKGMRKCPTRKSQSFSWKSTI